MERTGTFGGGPGSAPGERRWAKARWEPDDGACMAGYIGLGRSCWALKMFATAIDAMAK
jgi:hypothetical protein